jgi:hypothetical protein
VGGKHHDGPLGRLIELVDENGALGAQILHHIAVVDNLVTHVDGRPEQLKGPFHDVNGAVHAGTEPARLCQDNLGRAGDRLEIGHYSTPSKDTSMRRSAPARG